MPATRPTRLAVEAGGYVFYLTLSILVGVSLVSIPHSMRMPRKVGDLTLIKFLFPQGETDLS